MFSALLIYLLFFQDNEPDIRVDEQVKVNFVTLDVQVTDRRGRPIKDLDLSAFEVTDNGKPVEVTLFEILDYNLPTKDKEIPMYIPQKKDPEAPPRQAPPVQQIVLALDMHAAKPKEITQTFEELRKFADGLDETVPYMVNIYSLERGTLTDGFVREKKEIQGVLYRYESMLLDAAKRGYGRGSSSTTLDYGGGYQSDSVFLDGPSDNLEDLEQALVNCSRAPLPGKCFGDVLESYSDMQMIRSKKALNELELLTYDFQDVPGLKILLYVSPGFSLNGIKSAYRLASKIASGGRGGDGFGIYDPNFDQLQEDFQRVVHASIRNRVVFNTFNPINTDNGARRNSVRFSPGINAGPADDGFGLDSYTDIYQDYEREINEGLADLAYESGGSFSKALRLSPQLEKVLDESKYYYVLGYQAPDGETGQFRKIKVKVDRKRTKVHHRRGYFAP